MSLIRTEFIWRLETLDPDGNDVIASVDTDYFVRLPKPTIHQRRVLCRFGTDGDRLKAYVRSGKLGKFFEADIKTVTDIKVPDRFRIEAMTVLAKEEA